MKLRIATILQKKLPPKIPLRFALIIPFILVVTFTVSLASYIVFFNGQKAVNDIAYQLRSEVSARIADHLHGFLEIPHQINQFNINPIQQGWLDTKNSRDMQDYFLEQVKTHDTITSIYFGNIDGGIIGSGREGAGGALYVYDTENLKIGTFNKYAITDTGNIGELLTSIPNFDTRIRPWYIDATQNGTATWSDIYILFTGQDMAISASSPVYDEHHHLLGVVSVDIFLSQIENFLATLDISKSGQSFIMEHSGLLVAASSGERSFRENNGKMERLDARNSRTPIVKYATEFLHGRLGENYDVAHDEQFDFETNGERYFLTVSPLQDQYGIDWLIVVVIPESDFMSEITATNQTTLFIIIMALALSILSSIFIAQKIADRISYLNKFTRAFTNGGMDGLVLSESHISEIDELTLSFVDVKRQLRQTLDDLHAEVGIRKLIEQALRESEALFRAIFEQAAAGIFTLSLEGKFLSANQRFCDITGYTREELLSLFFKDIIHPDDLSADLANKQTLLSNDASTYSAEKRYFRKDGATIWVNLTVSLLSDMAKVPLNFLGIVEDITERKRAEDELHRSKEALEAANLELQTALASEKQLSHTDALTGINNRRHLFELAEREFDIATRYQHPFSVMMFDIDHFKGVNDIFGHAVGDQILQRVTQIACAELRSADVIGRYGGEEFVIMLPMTDAQQAYPVAERIRAGVLALRVSTPKGDVAVTVSIGISEIILKPQDESVEDVIRRADEAMYASKRAGRNRTVIFDPK
jgi:diguanylate cyclase (GGDEF)-like protein/PAS domain S-box-containing protein